MTDQTPSTEDVRDAFIVTRETIQDVALSVLSKYPGHHDQSAAREIAALASNAGRPAAARDRATAAKAAKDRRQLVVLLSELVDPDPCWFDHHGGCQAHGYLSLEPGQTCPVQDAKAIIEADRIGAGHE